VELKNASSKMAATLIDALGQSIREPKSILRTVMADRALLLDDFGQLRRMTSSSLRKNM
jgi:hypothetical protein